MDLMFSENSIKKIVYAGGVKCSYMDKLFTWCSCNIQFFALMDV